MLSTVTYNKSWYLIYSKPRKETSAREHLERQGYTLYLPLIRRKTQRHPKKKATIAPLFPRYLFIHLDKVFDNWVPIRSTIGVNTIVTFGDVPASIPDRVIRSLMNNEDASGLQQLPSSPAPQPGDVIRITRGPLTHCQGIFMARTAKERVIILLSMLGQASPVTMPADHMEPTL